MAQDTKLNLVTSSIALSEKIQPFIVVATVIAILANDASSLHLMNQ